MIRDTIMFSPPFTRHLWLFCCSSWFLFLLFLLLHYPTNDTHDSHLSAIMDIYSTTSQPLTTKCQLSSYSSGTRSLTDSPLHRFIAVYSFSQLRPGFSVSVLISASHFTHTHRPLNTFTFHKMYIFIWSSLSVRGSVGRCVSVGQCPHQHYLHRHH